MTVAEFLYTTVCNHRTAKKIVNACILAILPKSVLHGPLRIMLNPRDPVVSGALLFRCYERREVNYFQSACQPGSIVVDVGANVGLYTAIAGAAVGPSGRVIAVEPDPESLGFLKQTIAANGLTNTTVINAAAAEAVGKARLFKTSANKADNRLYNHKSSDGHADIDTFRLDDWLEANGVSKVDLIKIDVQGFEGHVIAGLQKTIARSPRLRILLEFWPLGLKQAGTDPLVFLRSANALGLKEYVLGRRVLEPVTDKIKLIDQLRGRKYTNLVLANFAI